MYKNFFLSKLKAIYQVNIHVENFQGYLNIYNI